MPRTERALFFTDTETTGLDPTYHEILQIAVIKTNPKGDILEKYSARLKPLWPDRIDPKAAAVNGYKPEAYTEDLCDHRKVVAAKIIRMMSGCIPVGHNIKFDIGFIQAFLAGESVKPSWHYHSIDTMVLAWPLFQAGLIDYFNLDTLCDYFKIPRPEIHTAVEDIAATHRAYLELMKCLKVEPQ